MKRLLLLLFLSLFLNAKSQDFSKNLQSHMWYVVGDLIKGKPTNLYSDKIPGCTQYLNFYKDGKLEMNLDETNSNFACNYEVSGDKLKLSYEISTIEKGKKKDTSQVEHYFLIKAVPNTHDFELLPIPASDYK